MLRVVAYARVSTDKNDQKNSLEAQIQFFEELFEKPEYTIAETGMYCTRKGQRETIKGFYIDEGISGTSLKHRNAFMQMVEDAKNGHFDMILTKSISRYSRNVGEGAMKYKELKAHGVGIYFVTEGRSTLSHDDEVLINILMSLAQQESATKSDNVKFGKRKSQQKGKWISTEPYGYKKVSGMLEIIDQEAETVRLIYDLYNNHEYGLGKIARHLNDQLKIKSKTNSIWTQKQISSVLENPLYIGVQRNHRFEMVDVNLGLQKKLPPEEWIIHKFEHLRIVDDELFERTQQRRRERSGIEDGRRHRHSTAHLFSNLLYCGNCGSALKRKRRNGGKNKDGTRIDKGYEWCCRMNDMYRLSSCAYRNAIPEERLTNYIQKEIISLRKQKEQYLPQLLNQYLGIYYDNKDLNERLLTLDRSIEEETKVMENMLRLNASGMLSDNDYHLQYRNVSEELRRFKNEKAKLLIIDQKIADVRSKYKEFVACLDQIDVETMSNLELRKLVSRIELVTYDPPTDPTTLEMLAKGKYTKDVPLRRHRDIQIHWMFLDKPATKISEQSARKMVEQMAGTWK